jgi:hypothetical protein
VKIAPIWIDSTFFWASLVTPDVSKTRGRAAERLPLDLVNAQQDGDQFISLADARASSGRMPGPGDTFES